MKREDQHSVYIDKDAWNAMKDMAWQRRMSVSALIVSLFIKEAGGKKKPKGLP